MLCRRDSQDVLVRMFLDRYHVNLLSPPGDRVEPGSVYVKIGKGLTSPGDLRDLLEPPAQLPEPYAEPRLADLSGSWSDKVSAKAGLGLLEQFLAALGAPGLLDEVKASVQRSGARKLAFRFEGVSRESISPVALGKALAGRRLVEDHPLVRDGNRYFAVASVMRSSSISVQAADADGHAVDLGAGLAHVAEADVTVDTSRDSENEVLYRGGRPLAIAVELYELRWRAGSVEFTTPSGPLPVQGLEEAGEEPEPALIGEDDDAFIAVRAPAPSR
jgi:hypothetical protein